MYSGYHIFGCIHVHMGLYKTRYLLNCPKSCYRFFSLFSFSQLVSSFSSFLWVWKSLWSRVNGCHLLFSSPFIAFHVALISSHVPFILQSFPFMLHSCPFILHSCPFIFRSGGYPPKHSRFCHTSLSFWLSFSYRFGGLCRLPSQASWTCAYVSSLSFLFPLIVF